MNAAIDEESLSVGLGVAAYQLQAATLAMLVGSKIISVEDAIGAIDFACAGVRKSASMPDDVKVTAQAALAALIPVYRKRL